MSGPVYTYTADTPQSANPMNVTAPVIRANFQAINELINVNHVTFNTSDQGKHNFISLINTTDPTTTSTEIAMFSKVTGSPNPCELFIQYPLGNQSSELVVEISEPTPSPAPGTSGGNASQGWCSFTSGVLLRWGTFSCATNSNPQVYITLSSGPIYKTNQTPSVVAPTSYGCLMPTGIGVDTGFNSNPQRIVTQLSAYVSPSTIVNFNYLLMGM